MQTEKRKTNYEKIIEFHQSFGLPYFSELNQQELQNFKTVSLRVKLINEEFNELFTAKTLVTQLDAIGDLLYVVYGAGASFGINLDEEFEKVFQFNVQHAKNSSFYNSLNSEIKKIYFADDVCIRSNFQKILYLCPRIGISIHQPGIPQPNYLVAEKSIKFRRLIKTLSHSLLMEDHESVKNILVQMLIALYCVGYFCHFDLDKLYDEIHRSNMSKLCNSEDEAKETIEWYTQNQSTRYPKVAYHKSIDDKHYIVFDQNTDKRLKSIHYTAPNIDLKALAI